MSAQTGMDTSQLSGQWTLDPAHTRLEFAAKHAMITTVRGSFTEFSGTLRLDGEKPENSFASVTIQASSINTGQSQRDGHLQSNDFLDVPTYPEIHFQSTSISTTNTPGRYELRGDLTIKGETKPVELDVTFEGSAVDPFGDERVGFSATGQINRTEWGVSFNAPLEAGGVLVSEKIDLNIDVSATRAE